MVSNIGVTDNLQAGSWAYDSDGSNVTFNPEWHHVSGGSDLNCILFSDKGDWADFSCTSKSPSTCESNIGGQK